MIVESCMQHGEKHDRWLINISGQNLDNNTGNNDGARRDQAENMVLVSQFRGKLDFYIFHTLGWHHASSMGAGYVLYHFFLIIFSWMKWECGHTIWVELSPPSKVQNGYVE